MPKQRERFSPYKKLLKSRLGPHVWELADWYNGDSYRVDGKIYTQRRNRVYNEQDQVGFLQSGSMTECYIFFGGIHGPHMVRCGWSYRQYDPIWVGRMLASGQAIGIGGRFRVHWE